jgi:hypothetical protein
MTRLALLLAFAMAACGSEGPPPSASTAERGAVHYHQVGGIALACTTWGFDTVCRNP